MSVNMTAIPQNLGTALGVSTFAAGVLASCFIYLMFTLPIIIFARNNIVAYLTLGIGILSFCVAISWLPAWTLFVIVFIIALMFADKIRNWISAGEEKED